MYSPFQLLMGVFIGMVNYPVTSSLLLFQRIGHGQLVDRKVSKSIGLTFVKFPNCVSLVRMVITITLTYAFNTRPDQINLQLPNQPARQLELLCCRQKLMG